MSPSEQPQVPGTTPGTGPPGRSPFARLRDWLARRARRSEQDFLPSALEIVERPASPAARTVALTLVAFFTIAVVWAMVGEVDIVAVAQGKIVPAGGVQAIQSLEIGVVRAIHVREGQDVKSGDLLIELDPTESEVDKGQVARELVAAQVDFARQNAMLRALDGGKAAFTAPKGADPNVVMLHRERLKSDILAHEAKLAALEGEFSKRIAERAAIKAEISKLEATIPLVAEREKSLAGLIKKGIAPRRQWLEVKQTLIEQRQDLAIEKHRLAEADAALVTIQKQRKQAEAEARREVLGEIVEVQNRISAATLQLRKVEKRERLQRLRAPADGVVQQLQVHTVGGVVTPAQVLMVVVPKNTPLEIEAMIFNKDKGFVEAGQAAEIKVESFSFTKYGVVDGHVKHVSGDAVQDENLGLIYPARVAMSRTTMRVDGRDVPLVPGMAVTVEIKTGKRQIIEFLMSPLLRYRQESLRER
ncbi:MAG: HlyD family type I secretion periplasmic adaptor subunit [Alphaproteobacteria bacterium]|jgi:hemolysin D|nr:HlyD family type I secretion periplasmic adaptor subunit [Alphaproteobacteria bacterium]